MNFMLSEQARSYLIEIEEALSLPHACGSNHEELREIITKLKNFDNSVNNPQDEIGKILRILGKYSYVNTTGNVSTADTFYELFHKLFNLTQRFKIIEDPKRGKGVSNDMHN